LRMRTRSSLSSVRPLGSPSPPHSLSLFSPTHRYSLSVLSSSSQRCFNLSPHFAFATKPLHRKSDSDSGSGSGTPHNETSHTNKSDATEQENKEQIKNSESATQLQSSLVDENIFAIGTTFANVGIRGPLIDILKRDSKLL